jgi:hypothetical protein
MPVGAATAICRLGNGSVCEPVSRLWLPPAGPDRGMPSRQRPTRDAGNPGRSARSAPGDVPEPGTLPAFITAALDAGVPLRDVQEATSHADPRTRCGRTEPRSTDTPPMSSPPTSPVPPGSPCVSSGTRITGGDVPGLPAIAGLPRSGPHSQATDRVGVTGRVSAARAAGQRPERPVRSQG